MLKPAEMGTFSLLSGKLQPVRTSSKETRSTVRHIPKASRRRCVASDLLKRPATCRRLSPPGGGTTVCLPASKPLCFSDTRRPDSYPKLADPEDEALLFLPLPKRIPGPEYGPGKLLVHLGNRRWCLAFPPLVKRFDERGLGGGSI